jgi:hypothetical protein
MLLGCAITQPSCIIWYTHSEPGHVRLGAAGSWNCEV